MHALQHLTESHIQNNLKLFQRAEFSMGHKKKKEKKESQSLWSSNEFFALAMRSFLHHGLLLYSYPGQILFYTIS